MSSWSKSRTSYEMSKRSSMSGRSLRNRSIRGISHLEANVASAVTFSCGRPRAIFRARDTARPSVVERLDRSLMDDGSRLGQPHRAAGADEQRHAELIFDLLDLMADRRRRQPKLVGRAGEIQVPGRCFERPQGTGTGNVTAMVSSNKFYLIR